MTEEQIKQNAEEHANSMRMSTENPPSDCHIGIYDGFIAGAHSRDEEVDQLHAELKEAQNPWISVEERKPEEDRDLRLSDWEKMIEYFVLYDDGTVHKARYQGYGRWICSDTRAIVINEPSTYPWEVTHWMPIPQAPKGGEG